MHNQHNDQSMQSSMRCTCCQMRIKGALLLTVCLILTTIFYCLLGDSKPTIVNNIVSETHRQLSHLKGVVISSANIYGDNTYANSNTDESEQRCDKYLRALGFAEKPRLFPNDVWNNVTLPVFVTAVNSDQIDLAIGFVKTIQEFVPHNTLLIYDLGLDDQQINELNSVCNSTSICWLRKFNYDNYPSHVSDLKLFAFRPIIIQEVLDQTGAVLWLDADNYLIPSANTKTLELSLRAKKEGIISWTINQPTSSLTHPRMFEYFKTSRDNYFFHRMIKPSHILLYNTERIHNDLMLPWVRCALTIECIAPIGSQASGCRFDKKPLYRYSGCHHYDTSAINVILGIMFNYNEKQYAAEEDDKFFRTISIEDNNLLSNDYTIDGELLSSSVTAIKNATLLSKITGNTNSGLNGLKGKTESHY